MREVALTIMFSMVIAGSAAAQAQNSSSTLCANWTLTIQGNTAASSETRPSP